MQITRAWAMPSPNTFSVPPIAALLDRHLAGRESIVDPFARDASRGHWTNDLNPTTTALCHMDAVGFCAWLKASGIVADALLFDPPYSPRQISECYRIAGRTVGTAETQNAALYKRVRDGLDQIARPGAVAISFGWNSAGFGKSRNYQIEEILLVAHGGAHNDTIVTVERKL